MAWIESHDTLWHHPKVKKLARLLAVPEPYAVGLLHYLWWWAVKYAPTGDLGTFEAVDIAEGIEWPGDPAQLLDALVAAGFVEVNDDGGWVLHDWFDYAGRLIERQEVRRAQTRERVQRWRQRQAAVPSRNPSVTRYTPVTNASGNADETACNAPTIPNLTKPNPTEPYQDTDPAAPSSAAPEESAPAEEVCGNDPVEGSADVAATDPRSRHAREDRKTASSYSAEFEALWAEYPRKVEKQRAWRAWRETLHRGVPVEDLVHATQRYIAQCRRDRVPPRYIKHPATFWGRDQPWQDYLAPPEPVPAPEARAPDAEAMAQMVADRVVPPAWAVLARALHREEDPR